MPAPNPPELLPTSVRSVMLRPEATLGLDAAFARDVRALMFRRLRTAGIVYALLHALALGVLVVFGVGPIQAAALQRAVAIVFALSFAAVTYAEAAERWALPLSVALTIGNAAYSVLPMLRYGVAGGSDHGTLVLFIVFTGWAFPYTLRQILAVLGVVLAMYLAAALPRLRPEDAGWLVEGLFLVTSASVITAFGTHLAHELRKREARASFELSREREAAEQLLLNILPESIVERLKRDQSAIAEGFLEATVLFVDLVGFTSLSAKMAPGKLVEMLNEVFSRLDALTEKYGLEKIKTIGDAYMAVAGVPTPRKDHAVAVAQMALELRDVAKNFRAPTGEPLQIRIGINSGPVVAGVIGTKKFSYDLWGDTVNTAARMEAHAEPGTIQVTERTYERLRTQFHFEPRGTIAVKGKGEMKTYVLMGPRASLRPPPLA
ncbi:MAG: adenylate/guanylate cyclase domain-containing protein [Polyangiaceae bacterium]